MWIDELKDMVARALPDRTYSGVTDEQIEQLQKLCALHLPEDYVLFLKTFGGDDGRIFVDTGDRVDISFDTVMEGAQEDHGQFGPLHKIVFAMPDVVNYYLDLRTGMIISDAGPKPFSHLASSVADWSRQIIWLNYGRKHEQRKDATIKVTYDVQQMIQFTEKRLREEGYTVHPWAPLNEIYAEKDETSIMIFVRPSDWRVFIESQREQDAGAALVWLQELLA